MNCDIARRNAVPWRLIALTLAFVAGGCVVVAVGSALAGIDLRVLFEDFQKIADVPFYTGMMSTFSVLLWFCSVAVGLFAALVLWSRPRFERRGRPDAFLASWSAFGGVLAVDDMLLVHERIAPHYLRIPEEVLVFGYAAVTAYLVLRWWVFITRRTPAAVLWLSIGFFAISLVVEYVIQYVSGVQTRMTIFVEDGLKLVGIVLWFLYFGTVAFRALAGGGVNGRVTDFSLVSTSARVLPDDRPIGGEPAGLSSGNGFPSMQARL